MPHFEFGDEKHLFLLGLAARERSASAAPYGMKDPEVFRRFATMVANLALETGAMTPGCVPGRDDPVVVAAERATASGSVVPARRFGLAYPSSAGTSMSGAGDDPGDGLPHLLDAGGLRPLRAAGSPSTGPVLGSLTPLEQAALGWHAGCKPLGLVVVRESDKWKLELFNAMREQTYQNLRHLPAVEAVRRAGLDPLAGGTFTVDWVDSFGRATREEVRVEPVEDGATTAVLFHFRGFWHLWSRASAAKTKRVNNKRENEFTNILLDVVGRLQPRALFAANLSRLVRSTSQGSRLIAQLDGNVGELYIKDTHFDLSPSKFPVTAMMLNILFWCAAMERDAIVQRLVTGKIAKWRRGEWPMGEATIPFGYKLVKKKLVPRPELRHVVREMLIILTSDAPPAEMVRQLDAIGVLSTRKHRRLGGRTPLTALSDPHYAVRTLYTWAAIWVSGEYLARVANVFPEMTELAGVPIVRRTDRLGRPDADDDGEMQMLHTVPVPDGGWAEPALLEAFAEAAVRYANQRSAKGSFRDRPLHPSTRVASKNPRLLTDLLSHANSARHDAQTAERRSGARARKQVTPLTGRGWKGSDGQHWFELQVAGSSLYRIVRWALLPGEDPSQRVAGQPAVTTGPVDALDDEYIDPDDPDHEDDEDAETYDDLDDQDDQDDHDDAVGGGD